MKAKKKLSPNSDVKLAELKTQILELQDKLARSLADYANLSKRIDSQQEMFATLASATILTKMVEVLDNFSLAYKHLPDPGLKMAVDRFIAVLKEEGLTEINALNLPFDPQFMECIGTVPGKVDQVISVEKPGYALHGTCLRPAQVIVGKDSN